MYLKLLIILTVVQLTLLLDKAHASGYCSTGATYSSCGNNDLCKCEVELARAIRGQSVNTAVLKLGGNIVDMFLRGGSENIPVVCNAAYYYVRKNPQWFSDYFDIQFNNTSGVGMFGSEFFSPTYFAHTVGAIIAVRKKAASLGHTTLVGKADRWLRAYWTMLSLMGTYWKQTYHQTYAIVEGSGAESFTTVQPSPQIAGYGIVLPGNRGYVNSSGGGVGLQSALLSMALAHPNRTYAGTTLNVSPGYYGGICAAALAGGYPWNGDKVNLQGSDPGPAAFGLTASERSTLQNYIYSGGAGVSTLLGYLSGIRVNPELTIRRTTLGISAWMGNNTGNVVQIYGSSSKGGAFGVALFTSSNNTSIYVSRARHENSPGYAYTNASPSTNQVCMNSDTIPAQKCLPLVGGTKISQVYFPRLGNVTQQ